MGWAESGYHCYVPHLPDGTQVRMAEKVDKSKGVPSRVPMPDMRRGLRAYFSEVRRELGKVIWPSKAETVRLTVAVLIVCAIFVAYLFAFGKIVELVFDAITGKKPIA